MVDPIAFYLGAKRNVVLLNLIEIHHPDFGYLRYVNNDDMGVTVTHEDGKKATYGYESFDIQKGKSTSDLDQAISITFADYKDDLRNKIESANHDIAPTFKFRQYIDTDLSSPMNVEDTLHILSVSSDSYGLVTFDATTESLGNSRTGSIYTILRFPSLAATI